MEGQGYTPQGQEAADPSKQSGTITVAWTGVGAIKSDLDRTDIYLGIQPVGLEKEEGEKLSLREKSQEPYRQRNLSTLPNSQVFKANIMTGKKC